MTKDIVHLLSNILSSSGLTLTQPPIPLPYLNTVTFLTLLKGLPLTFPLPCCHLDQRGCPKGLLHRPLWGQAQGSKWQQILPWRCCASCVIECEGSHQNYFTPQEKPGQGARKGWSRKILSGLGMLRKRPGEGVGLIFHYCVNRQRQDRQMAPGLPQGEAQTFTVRPGLDPQGNSRWALIHPESGSSWWQGERRVVRTCNYLNVFLNSQS